MKLLDLNSDKKEGMEKMKNLIKLTMNNGRQYTTELKNILKNIPQNIRENWPGTLEVEDRLYEYFDFLNCQAPTVYRKHLMKNI